MRRSTPQPIATPGDVPASLPGVTAGREPTIVVSHVSKWYGDIVAVSDTTFGVTSGVTALLGPNGAGKSTLLKMMSGLLTPSTGSILIQGKEAKGNIETYRRFGLVHESESVYPYLTGREFVRLNAIMQKLGDIDAATERAIAIVELGGAANRRVGGYSKGMRQRIKVAAALVHDPDVILMDEPLNGMDPSQRAHMIALIRELGRTKTVLVSSHVLAEVERFADNILVIVNGKLAAAGDYRAIRDRMDDRDHSVRIRADHPRFLAMALIGHPATRSIRVDGENRIVAETNDVRGFYRALPQLAKKADVRLFEVQATDESLQSVFSYLVER
ncbi:MAG: ABC transporter ATP-binding protein [Thermomicrobiales bacterium]|nr:ABC transporter ATP-binding protein [Thermomicrobiales bacterium]